MRLRLRIFFALIVSLLSCSYAWSNSPSVMQVYPRPSTLLDGEWKIFIDPYLVGYHNYHNKVYEDEAIISKHGFFTDSKVDSESELLEYNFDTAQSLDVPGDWNTQMPELLYYEGNLWYRTTFDKPKMQAGDRVFLNFGAVNYHANVYLNGQKIGEHLGGFTPFEFEIGDMLKPLDNSLVVKVDNTRSSSGIPTANTDWWNYGGITRSVRLTVVPKHYIRDYRVTLDSLEQKQASIQVTVDGENAQGDVTIKIPELGLSEKKQINQEGIAEFQFHIEDAQLWEPSSPKRYKVSFSFNEDKLEDEIGFRTIATKGKQILLNGEPIFLKGISIHEEYAEFGGGRVKNAEEASRLLTWAKELGVNFVRLAHYPHNEHMVRLAEKMGIMVWAEVPVYWVIDWANPETYQNAQQQLSELIHRDKNRAAVIIWSVANETPISEERNRFIGNLIDHARELDDSRLISAALLHHIDENTRVASIQDPLSDKMDIISFNQYLGWYNGLPDKIPTISWQIDEGKPVFVSEFGAGALAGLHGPASKRWTEEFQADLYQKTLEMLDKIDGFSGTSPWILADFRSPKRILPGIQDKFNRKGVVSETGQKKKAFYVLRDYYKNK